MPIVNSTQAQIDLGRGQAQGLIEILQDILSRPSSAVPNVSIEETNLDDCVAVVTKRGTTLVYNNEVHNLGRGA